MITDPAALTVLCFGDSNTHGAPGDDPDYQRLGPDVRWPGQLQRRLGEGWNVIEEGLNGRTINSDYADRPGLNGRSYLIPCLLSHAPLDVVVLMLGTNDVKVDFGLSVAEIAGHWDGFLTDLFANVWTRDNRRPEVILVSPITVDADQARFAEEMDSFDAASVAKSTQLAAAYRPVAERNGLAFFDAATVARAGADGIHLTVASHAQLATALAQVIIAEYRAGMRRTMSS
jgi:lysophospholipase L1-like esterase